MSDPATNHALERIVNRCLSESSLLQLNEFFDREHTEYVITISESKSDLCSDRASMRSGSNNREYTNVNYVIYRRFSNLIEEIIQDSCRIEHVDIEQFYRNCAAENLSPAFDVFSKVLLISTDFQAFDDVMRNPEVRRYMFKLWRDWGNVMSKSELLPKK